jgi:hypothetical protein
MAKGKAASLNPDGFVEGGSLVYDVDVVCSSITFDMFDYNGTVEVGVPSIKGVLDVEGEEMTQYWSMGSAKDWAPSEDGKMLLAVGKAENIRMSSNGGIFLKSLVDAGFPPDKLDDDITVLDGMECHMVRVPAPERKGLKKKENEYAGSILIVSEIYKLPWEKKTAKASGKPSTSKKAQAQTQAKATKANPGGDVEAEALTIVLAILGEQGAVPKTKLPGLIFQAAKDNPNRNDIVKVAFNDDFLASGPWTFKDGTILPA